jgi:hypothetical protein
MALVDTKIQRRGTVLLADPAQMPIARDHLSRRSSGAADSPWLSAAGATVGITTTSRFGRTPPA